MRRRQDARLVALAVAALPQALLEASGCQPVTKALNCLSQSDFLTVVRGRWKRRVYLFPFFFFLFRG
jgi:hypothetical protein